MGRHGMQSGEQGSRGSGQAHCAHQARPVHSQDAVAAAAVCASWPSWGRHPPTHACHGQVTSLTPTPGAARLGASAGDQGKGGGGRPLPCTPEEGEGWLSEEVVAKMRNKKTEEEED